MLNITLAPTIVVVDGTIKCSICESTYTRPNKKGRPVWRFDAMGQARCYQCNLDRLRSKSEETNKATRCQSAMCVKNRSKLGARPNYPNKAHCMKCRTNHPAELTFCPCCNQRLRKKARYNKAKYLASKLKV